MHELVVIEKLDPVVIFTDISEIDAVLKRIETEVMAHVPVLDTASGRKDIASIAYKVAQSKTALDNLGKNLVTDWKAKTKKVDDVRKYARDYLEALKYRVRQPLTDWEKAEAARVEKEKLAILYAAAWDEAQGMNDLFNREKAVREKEAEFARQEQARLEAEAKAKAEQERIDREKRIAQEAADRAKAEAEAKIKAAEQAKKKAEQEKIAAVEQAEAKQAEAEKAAQQAAKQAELDRIAAVKAEQERARKEAERVERERLAKEAEEKAKADKIAANKAHQKKINAAALACFEQNGIETEAGKNIIRLIVSGKIDHITINY